jgi:cellulose synthase/poly-beta-1,6-N-acetylglucosamine synthase-like glycosyltransferase
MSIVALILMALYVTGLSMILLFTFLQLHLAVVSRNSVKNGTATGPHKNPESFPNKKTESFPYKQPEPFPFVTIQLPVYNERYVIERLLNSVTNLNWPANRLEIQILDDSTDDTSLIIGAVCNRINTGNITMKHIRRNDRTGFKAGALQYGLERAEGEFIAIFDADFMPESDFLLKTIPEFDKPGIGLVQTRWGHINRDYSILTKLQALALDAHFTVEQQGRNRSGFFMNFNGTAGVWRKSCILDAGGWHHDTLTEDLDISYRAQLKGWEFRYLGDVVTPAELPVAVSALKTQQYRWTKGAAETARKNLAGVIRSKMTAGRKMHAISHLLSSSVFIWILLVSVVSVPLLWLKYLGYVDPLFFKVASFFIVGLLLWIYFYETSMIADQPDTAKRWKTMLVRFPLFLAVSMALGYHNSIAVISGYAGRKSPFVRTPKFNTVEGDASWKSNIYLVRELGIRTLFEGGLMLLFLFGVISAFLVNDFGLIPFHVLLFAGYGILFSKTIYEANLKPAGT